MKLLLTAAAATALLTTLALPATTHAGDHKAYHGSDCKVFGSTAWTDLSFTGYGVKNLASSARNIICPITKDSEGLWDGEAITPTNIAYLVVSLETGSVASSYSCTVYATTSFGATTVNSYAISSGGQKPANTFNYYPTGNFDSVVGSPFGYWDKAYMLCTLGPQVRLVGYHMYEQAATNL